MEQELGKQDNISEKKEPDAPKNPEISTPQNAETSFIKLATAAFAGGLLAVLIVIGWQWFYPPAQNTILTVDPKQVINYKLTLVRDKYKGNYTEASAKIAEEEIRAYMDKAQAIIDGYSRHNLVLVKEAVPTTAQDITSRIIAVVEGSTPEKIQADIDKLRENEQVNTQPVPLPLPPLKR